MMGGMSQIEREALVREALALDGWLIRCLAEWVGRDLSGIDWESGLPWRIETRIRELLQEINSRLEKCDA